METYMKRVILFLSFILYVNNAYSAYLKNVPVTLQQPNGNAIQCFVTGDEFHRRLHDENNYTIVLDPSTGNYVYADLKGDQLIPTHYIVGQVNPDKLPLHPGYTILSSEMEAKRTNNLKSAANVPVNPTKGNFNNIVISIRFADQVPTSLTLEDYENKFNSTTGISLKTYFGKASNSQLNVNSIYFPDVQDQVIVEYQDNYSRSYYFPYNEQTNPDGYTDEEWQEREQALFSRALKDVEAQIVESSIDFDLNNDGTIDNIIFIIQGAPDNWGKLLWPQTSYFFNGLTINGLKAGSYNKILSSMFEVSVINHEFFHSLGAPDLYRYYEYSIDPVGPWDIMGWSGDCFMTTYMKWRYGKWFDNLPEITSAGTYSLADIASHPFSCFKIPSPGNPDEYFIVEYRKKDGLFDASIPGEGLLIYRINTDKDGLGNANGPEDELYIYRPAGTVLNNGAIQMAHFADNCNRKEFNDLTDPSCFLSGSEDGGIQISDIRSTGGEISFDVSFSASVLKLKSPNGNESWKAGTQKEIEWSGKNVSKIDIHYTLNGGVTWNLLIEEIPGSQEKFSWVVPDEITSDAGIKITDSENNLITDESDLFFTIRDVNYISENEPNDIFSLANVLEIGDSVKSVLNYGTDADYYKFFVDSSKTVSITITFDEYKHSTGTSKYIELFNQNYNCLIFTVYDDLTYTFEESGWYYIKYAFAIDNETFECPYTVILEDHNRVIPEIEYMNTYSVYSNSAKLSATVKSHGINTHFYFLFAEYDPTGNIPKDSVALNRMVEAKNNPYNSLNNEIIMAETITGLNPNTSYLCKVKAQNEYGAVLSTNSFYFKTPPAANKWTRFDYNIPNSVTGVSFISESTGSLMVSDIGNFDGLQELLTAVMRTEDAGASWIYQNKQVPPACYTPLMYIRMIDKDIIYTWGYGGIQKSADGGETWVAVSIVDDMNIYDIAFITPEHWIVAGAPRIDNGQEGKILITKDGGKNWTGNDDFYDGSIRKIAFNNEGEGMYVSSSNKKIYMTKDFGLTWETIYESNEFNPMDVVNISGKWFVCGYDGIIYSADNGNTWYESEILPVKNGHPYHWHYNLAAIEFSDSMHGVAAGHNGMIFRTKNGGSSWFFDEPGTLNYIFDLEYIDNTIWAVGHDGLILKKEIDGNEPPVANAGTSQTVNEGEQVVLDGSGSYHPEGNELTYFWMAPEGIELSSEIAVQPTFTAPEVSGDSVFLITLIVDDGLLKDTAHVVISVADLIRGCPRDTYNDDIADGGTQGPRVGQSITVLNSGVLEKIELTIWPDERNTYLILREWQSNEYDSAFDGAVIAISDYAVNKPAYNKWQEMSTFYFSSNPELTAGNNYLIEVVDGTPYVKIPGTYSGGMAFETANPTAERDMRFALYVCPDNNNPVANAGPDQIVNEGQQVILDGSGSFHPYSEPFTFLWIAPGGIELSGTDEANPSFLAPEVEYDVTYVFTLIVDDGISKDSDQVVITINDIIKGCPRDAWYDEIPGNGTMGPKTGQSITALNTGILEKIELTVWPSGNPYLILREWVSDEYDSAFTGEIIAASDPAINKPAIENWQEMSTFQFPSNPELRAGTRYLIEVVNGTPYVKIPGTYSGGMAYETANPDFERDMRFALYICPHSNNPVADAGSNQTVISGELITLDGTGSHDPNSELLQFEWKAPECITLNSLNQPVCTFTAPHFSSDTTLIFHLVVTNMEGYSDTSNVEITIRKSVNVSVHSIGTRSISLYPNPSDGIVHLTLSNFETNKNYRLLVTNVLGEKVLDKQFNHSNNSSFDLSNQPAGVYFIQIIMENQSYLRKLIIK
jgi:M6 family metalloprotease-like protein